MFPVTSYSQFLCVGVPTRAKTGLNLFLCTTLLHLNQYVHSTAVLLVSMALGERLRQNRKVPPFLIPAADLTSLALSFWAENNILGIRFSAVRNRFALKCSEVALKQGELWHYEQEPCLAHHCSHCRRCWVLCFIIFSMHILTFI